MKVNPFNSNETYAYVHLADVLTSKANLSLVAPAPEACLTNYAQIEFNYEFGSSEEILPRPFPNILMVTRNIGFQYLTCYTERFKTFEIYIAPFQPQLWLTLFITLILLISIYSYVHRNSNFSSWLFILATLFEETGYVPSKMERSTFFRFSFGTWCIMSVVITNGYNGIMISELNAPLPSFQPENFDDLMCNKLSMSLTDKYLSYMSLPKGSYINRNNISKDITDVLDQISAYIDNLIISKFNYSRKLRNENCFNLYSAHPQINIGYHWPEFFRFLLLHYHANGIASWGGSSYLRKQYNIILNFLSPKYLDYPLNLIYDYFNTTPLQQRIEEEIIQCGKTVFIAQSNVVEAEHIFLSKKYPWHKFYKGSEILWVSWYGLAFRYAGFSKIPGYYKSVIESGVYGRIDQELSKRVNLDRNPVISRDAQKVSSKRTGLELEGEFSTFFIIWSSAIAIILPIVAFELRNLILYGIKFLGRVIYFNLLKILR
ncbi:hypothetical protein Fcan01_25941 [Folsomia candida]|uniref:Uncharacterized protein n=1 Tax=Folsomia candida TaxID=158441 RepID=A0A226D3A6_FOLCA|nr:hypothetical protein Fcan01_25941 [Folsomia candida]